MDERRRRTTRALGVVASAAAAVTSGYVVGSLIAGSAVPRAAVLAALASTWACVAALALRPRVASDVPGAAARTGDRPVDRVSGLALYDPADDLLVGVEGASWAALVVEVDDYLAAHAVDPGAADILLAGAAERISAVAASYGASVLRLQGPRYLVVVAGHDDNGVTALAASLHDAPGGTGAGRLVVGVAIAHHSVPDARVVTRSAMSAAAQAKRLEAEAPVFFHPRMAEEARERMTVGRALRTAIDAREIDLVYQPQLDLRDGSLVGVEVLARWHDPVHGLIAPDRFVRIAADLGLSRQLDLLVCEKAFEQLAAWDAANVQIPRICLNISARTLTDERPIVLEPLLSAYAIHPERVTLELVESGALEGSEGVCTVQRFRDVGLMVTLDDFGSGQSSFSQLLSLPVTGLKIDRSFLDGLEPAVHEGAAAGLEAPPDVSILAGIIEVGSALGLAVGAVGIETAAQHQLLRSLGCPAGQGYLFAHPMDAGELTEWVTRREGSAATVH